MPVTLEQANKIIEVALAEARRMKLPPVGVAVLDPGGYVKAVQCEDGLSFLRTRICQAKAYSALAMGTHTRHLAHRYESNLRSQGFMSALNAIADIGIVTLPGGVLIRDRSGGVLGAVGISGAASEDDEACAVKGIEALGYPVDLNA